MSQHSPLGLPKLSANERRVAAGKFERASEAFASGNFDYALPLLLDCCRLDPANLPYRQALRRAQRARYGNNLRGHWLAWLTTWPGKLRLKSALRAGDHRKVLDLGELVLQRNPWDRTAQMVMAEAAEELEQVDLAVWLLESARHSRERDTILARRLANLYEQRGEFSRAIGLWDIISRADPNDAEAARKRKDLAASETIARGQYERAAAPESTASGERLAIGARPDPSGERPALAAVPPAGRDVDTVRQRAEADPTNANGWIQLANLFRKQDDFEKAREALLKGQAATGNAFEITLALTELEIEPFRRNLALTERRIAEAPDDAELRKMRARLRKEINARELDVFRMKADRFPTEPGHRFEMGVRLLRAGQVEAAIAALQSVRNDERYRWQASYYLGHCFKERRNDRLAQRNFEEALKHMPATETSSRKEVLFLLASAAAEASEWARAVEIGTELANIDFAYKDIGRRLDEWQERLQRADAPP
jgi:tetratricopeptide (TPR) repeat protein